MAHTCD